MKIEKAIEKIKLSIQDLGMKSILKAQSALQEMARDPEFIEEIKGLVGDSRKIFELYRDSSLGFIFLGYSESLGTYRNPHNHGDAWVIYSVVTGSVEMGSYFRVTQLNQESQLIEKNREIISDAVTRIYYPGEIHDTHCVSETAIILRLTSGDLKEEERLGRMQRFQK